MRFKVWAAAGGLLGLIGCAPAQWPVPQIQTSHCVGSPIRVGSLQDPLLNEVSGLAASRLHPGCLWVHNDSGDGAYLYLLDSLGRTLGQFKLGNGVQRDWEDLALAADTLGLREYVYVGEIGDNDQVLHHISIYRLSEPQDLPPPGLVQRLAATDTFHVVYADGPRDCEALMVDPLTQDIYLISKREEHARLYHLPHPLRTDTLNVAQPVLRLPYTQVTAADISPDGAWVAVKNYDSLWVYARSEFQTVVAALAGAPCPAPYVREPQGEALAWQRHGRGVFTTSERRLALSLAPAIHYYPLRRP